MEIMKNKKIIAINLIIILVFNIFSTIIYSVLATENTNDENINKLEGTNETSDIVNIDNTDDNTKYIDELEYDENEYETIKDEKENRDKIIKENTENEQINIDTVEQKEHQEDEQKQDNNIQQIEQIQEEDRQAIYTEDDTDYVNKNIEVEEKNLNNREIKSSANEEFSLYVKINEYKINAYITDNIYYLFIPQGADLSNLIINYTGNVTNVSAGTLDINNKNILNDFNHNDTLIIMENNIEHTIKVMQSNLPSISISLNGTTLNEINNGSKDTKYKNNSLVIKSRDNSLYDFSNSNVEVKGRGNFTWLLPKKSYQIKFGDKYSILGMNKAKTWILLANYMDNSYARNKVAFDFANDIGLEYTPDYKFIDLWIDGEYLGNYMITEKVQVAKNRVDLKDDYGILVELDNINYNGEIYFKSKISNTIFTLKDSVADDVNKNNSKALESFYDFENYINEFEKYLYSEGKDWNKISSMIDVDSFIKYYFVQEFSENLDGCRSSVFMYKNGKNNVIYMGPVWDYDVSFANFTTENLGGNPNIDYILNIEKYMDVSNNWYSKLFEIKEFREEVIKVYNEIIKKSLDSMDIKSDNNMIESAKMNDIVWKTLGKMSRFNRINKLTYMEEVDYLKNWIEQRINYLNRRYCTNSDIININYKTHIQDIGWQDLKSNGEMTGTEGQSKRLEAIIINLDSFNSEIINSNIKYQVHIQDIGWQDWKSNGEMAGTEGQSKRLEAIKIKLEGTSTYNVMYRVHVQDIGWQDWKFNGETAGTEGQSKRVEAIEIKILKNDMLTDFLLSYNGHVENIGDTNFVSNGQIVGTVGRSLRLEGLNIQLNKYILPNISIDINEHIENIGWINGLTDSQYIGTKGKALRLEALSLKLNGNQAYNYTIRYRVHVQNIGWQDWKYDGDIAGTTGQSLRIEAIQIEILKK